MKSARGVVGDLATMIRSLPAQPRGRWPSRSHTVTLLSVMRPDLETALREEVTDRVDLRFGCSISQINTSTTGVTASLTDGSRIHADLLIGADGIHSHVRRLAVGPEEEFFRYLGFHAAAYVFDHPAVHARLRRRFCMTDSGRTGALR